jgi:selenocysteine lyase/cysteine desulfurase
MDTTLEEYFNTFRNNIIGIDTQIKNRENVEIPLIYTDWTASGRCYSPVEDILRDKIMPLVANTHTETSYTGMAMTYAYHKAQNIIKKHVNAASTDVLIATNSGMTGVVNKLQRILGLKIHEKFRPMVNLKEDDRPVVFITHMEHHSNQTSWLETIAEVIVVPPDEKGLVSETHFRRAFEQYSNRKIKIAAITSCSNVTGIRTPYHKIAAIAHQFNGLCFVDFACSAPYVDINMHPRNQEEKLDAIYFSPHKFLGGPGSSGVLIFCQSLYKNSIPDDPGGGTVKWTNPWGQHSYVDDIEAREDGGTPGFLQAIKTALAIRVKEKMGVKNILAREEELLQRIWTRLNNIQNLHVLAAEHKHRLGVVSFYIDGLHYNMGVKMLNDRYGIQVRGGCSCAGTYGHYLLNVDPDTSNAITSAINEGDCSLKPGWIRMSIHPTTANQEIDFVLAAIESLAAYWPIWKSDYSLNPISGEIKNLMKNDEQLLTEYVNSCFDVD